MKTEVVLKCVEAEAPLQLERLMKTEVVLKS